MILHSVMFPGCYQLVFHVAVPAVEQEGADDGGDPGSPGLLLEDDLSGELGFGDLDELLDQQQMMEAVEQQLQQELGGVLPQGWEVVQVGVGGGWDQQEQQRDVMLSLAGPAAAGTGAGAGVEGGAAAGGFISLGAPDTELQHPFVAGVFHLEPVAFSQRHSQSSSVGSSSSWGWSGLLELHCAAAPLEDLQHQGYSYLRVVLAEEQGAQVVADVKQPLHEVCKLGGVRLRLDQQHQQEAIFRHGEGTKWLGLVVLAGGREGAAAAADGEAGDGKLPKLLLGNVPVPVLPGAVCRELQQLLEGAVATGLPLATAYQEVILPVMTDLMCVLRKPLDGTSSSSGGSSVAAAASCSSRSSVGPIVPSAAVGEELQVQARASLGSFFDLHGLPACKQLLQEAVVSAEAMASNAASMSAVAAAREGGDAGVGALGTMADAAADVDTSSAQASGVGNQLQGVSAEAGSAVRRGLGNRVWSKTSSSSHHSSSSGVPAAGDDMATIDHDACKSSASSSSTSTCQPAPPAIQRAAAAIATTDGGSLLSRVLFWWYCIWGAVWGWRDGGLEGMYCRGFWPHSHTSHALCAVYDILMVFVVQARIWSAVLQGAVPLQKWPLIVSAAHSVPAVLFNVLSLVCVKCCWCVQYKGAAALLMDGSQAVVHLLHSWIAPQGVIEFARFLAAARVLSDDPFSLYLATALLVGILHVAFQRLPPPWLVPCAAANVVLLRYVMGMHDVMLNTIVGMCNDSRPPWAWAVVASYAEVSAWARAIVAVGLGVALVVGQEARSRAKFLRQAAASSM